MTTLFLTILLSFVNWRVPDWPILERPIYMSAYSPLAARLFASGAAAPVKKDILSLGPRLSAQSALVVDARSGATLLDKNSNTERPLASLTKLMTALVFLEKKPDLNQRIEMKSEDDREGGQTFIRPGESASLGDYLAAALIGSANNATMVLARSGGLKPEEFVKIMNERARALGMSRTRFVEPTGLDPANVSATRDLALLLRAVRDNDLVARLTTTRRGAVEISAADKKEKREILNTDELLRSVINIILGKTGYLDEALYNLAAAVKLKNGQEIFVVALGADSSGNRFQDAKNLAIWAEETYEWE